MSRAVPLLRAEFGKEIHLQRIRQLPRGPKREVDVAGEDLGYVRARYVHALGELSLADAQLLHAAKDAAEEGGAYMVKCGQGDAGKWVSEGVWEWGSEGVRKWGSEGVGEWGSERVGERGS